MSDYSKQPSHELHTPRHETSSQGWLWGGIAALIAVIAIAWFMTSGTDTATTTSAPPAVTQEAPAPAPAAPAAEPAPATPPATGSGTTTTPQ